MSLDQLTKVDSSGVSLSPTRVVVSLIILPPTVATSPSESKGRRVFRFTDAPIPPDAMSAREVLYTSTAETPSAAILLISKLRAAFGLLPLLLPRFRLLVGMLLPFKVTRLNCGPKPRTVI